VIKPAAGYQGPLAYSSPEAVQTTGTVAVNGSTQAMAQPRPSAKRKQSFMLFAYPTGAMGNVVSKGVNELIIPNYKQTWANIRKIADAPEVTRHLTFKSQEYSSG
jgi:arsenite oxidase large subunit